MTGRISIPALRERAEHGRDMEEFVPARDCLPVKFADVLALVEAVEAAAKHVEGCHQSLDLEVYLARFDFGEEA